MRQAGLIVAEALDAVRAAAAPGALAGSLDAIAEKVIRAAGATPSFLGHHGYPASICLSINDVVVHGIPRRQVLAEGDVVSVDCGAVLRGWHGDSAVTFGVGEVDEPARRLIEATEASLWAGIAAMARGVRVGDIGTAVADAIERLDPSLGVLEEYVGHGIGQAMHMWPDVPNYPTRDRGPRLRPGVTLAIEPMVVTGAIDTHVEADDWTVRTDDGGLAAHWEHTVARTEGGVWVLTAPDGGAAGLARHGLTPAPVAA
jgi:methionyl aminopeptidase